MTKRIVVLSDGTGNSAAKVWRTNVWRMYEAVDLSRDDQIAFYDDGIGSSGFKPIALIGGIFGYGLKRNTIECYKFLCRKYQPGCDIFLFGFSRGAFTMRVLIELVASQGLVTYTGNERKLHADANAAYRAYRKTLNTYTGVEIIFRFLRDLVWRTNYSVLADTTIPEIRFVGLWDTVAAYGLPFDEMTRVVSQTIFPLRLRTLALPSNVKRASHALALDEERTTFRPLMMRRSDDQADDSINQVWFSGVHANVGGGYPDDTLAQVSLRWMMQEAARSDLRFVCAPSIDSSVNDRSIFGRMYDSRAGFGAYYRYAPRNVADLYGVESTKERSPYGRPKIHFSVFERIRRPVQPYAPIGIPGDYLVVGADGNLLTDAERTNSYESASQSHIRFLHEKILWSSVLRRSATYIGIVATTAALIIAPLFSQTPASAEYSSPLRPLSDLVRIAGSFLPGAASLWVNCYARNPGAFYATLLLLLYLLALNSSLKGHISDCMRKIWEANRARPIGPWLLGVKIKPPSRPSRHSPNRCSAFYDSAKGIRD
jgi:uncharacterized protein (DUF2235 family)